MSTFDIQGIRDSVKHIQVKHALNPNFGFPTADRPNPVYPRDYTLVAIMGVPAGATDIELLEMAFQYTNHIDAPWWDNEGVLLVGEPKHRSTSVGDVVVLPDGTPMLCDLCGWKKVDDA